MTGLKRIYVDSNTLTDNEDEVWAYIEDWIWDSDLKSPDTVVIYDIHGDVRLATVEAFGNRVMKLRPHPVT